MFDERLAYHARVRPRAAAYQSPRRRVTYAELDADVNRYALALQDLGVEPSRGVVSVGTADLYRAHVYLLALARLGVTSGLRGDPAVDMKISERAGDPGDGVTRLTADWLARTQASPPTPVASAPRAAEGIARVILTSGTTGLPRRVPITWGRVETSAMNALVAYAAGRLGTWLVRTGIDSSLGFSLAALAWSMGACVTVGYGEGDLPLLFERQPEGLAGLTPLHLAGLLRNLPPGFEPKPGWRFVVTGGPVSQAVARDALRRLSPDILINYASTEAGRTFIGHARHLDTCPGAVGWPVPGVTAEILDPDGAVLPDGEVGELRIRSDRSAGRYLGGPDASSTAFRDGWFHPGDLARRTPDTGMFVIEGRIDERMNVGGMKLLPNALENAVLEHPSVRDAAAFAAPGPRGLDQCWIAVVSEGEVSRESLLAVLRAAPGPKPPVRFAWAEEIPRNAMGKIDRTALREQTLAALKLKPR